MTDKTKQRLARNTPGTWRTAWRNIGRRPRRSILSASAVAIAAFISIFMISLLAGINRDMENNIQRYLTGQIQIQHHKLEKAALDSMALYLPHYEELKAGLATIPGVDSISPRISSAASVFVNDDSVYFPFTGMDFETDPMALGSILQTGGKIPLHGEREALISTGLATKLGLKTGDVLTALTRTLRGSSNGMSFTIVGIVKPGLAEFTAPNMFIDISTAQRFTKMGDGVVTVLLNVASRNGLAGIRDAAQKVLDVAASPDYRAAIWSDTSTTLAFMGVAALSYGTISFVFFCLASTVIINTMLMVVFERTKEIGTLTAIGMESSAVQRLFIVESMILSGLGALAGTVLGSIVALISGGVGLDFSDSLQGIKLDVSSILHPEVSWYAPLVVVFAATAVATLFTLLPVRRIHSMKIVEALRGEQ